MTSRTNRTKRKVHQAIPANGRWIGPAEIAAGCGSLLIGCGLAQERISLALIWFGAVALFVTWGSVRLQDKET